MRPALWERFFNWQSGMDWTWGPFLSLRPSQETPLPPWVWVRLFLALSLAGLLLIASVSAACIFGPRLAARERWTMPPSLAETLATLASIGADPGDRLLLLGTGFSLPLLFFAACLPFHLAWNRRAVRLRQSPPSVTPPPSPADVWPPAPNMP